VSPKAGSAAFDSVDAAPLLCRLQLAGRTITDGAGLMAPMIGMGFFNRRILLSALCAPLFAAGLTACETATTAPADTHVAGSWQLDKAASDDPEATISKIMSAAESKLHQRLARSGYGPEAAAGSSSSSGDSAPDAPDYSFDTPGDRYGGPGRVGPDFRGLRVRLRQALLPPTQLRLEVQGDLVTISADQLPARDYRLGERISRFDVYGAAIITATWAHDAFVIKSNYTSHASRSDTYQVDAATGALTLTQQITDPTVGRIILHSVYRRG
jgi:hypothetical protein